MLVWKYETYSLWMQSIYRRNKDLHLSEFFRCSFYTTLVNWSPYGPLRSFCVNLSVDLINRLNWTECMLVTSSNRLLPLPTHRLSSVTFRFGENTFSGWRFGQEKSAPSRGKSPSSRGKPRPSQEKSVDDFWKTTSQASVPQRQAYSPTFSITMPA